MSLKSGTGTIFTARGHKHRSFPDRQHICSQHRSHSSGTGFITFSAKSGIKICHISFRQNPRVKLGLITFLFAQTCAIFIMNIAIKFVLSCRSITYSNGNYRNLVQHVIKIVPSVRSHRNIRGIQTHFAFRVQRIGCLRINHTLISPVAQVIDRS